MKTTSTISRLFVRAGVHSVWAERLPETSSHRPSSALADSSGAWFSHTFLSVVWLIEIIGGSALLLNRIHPGLDTTGSGDFKHSVFHCHYGTRRTSAGVSWQISGGCRISRARGVCGLASGRAGRKDPDTPKSWTQHA